MSLSCCSVANGSHAKISLRLFVSFPGVLDLSILAVFFGGDHTSGSSRCIRSTACAELSLFRFAKCVLVDYVSSTFDPEYIY